MTSNFDIGDKVVLRSGFSEVSKLSWKDITGLPKDTRAEIVGIEQTGSLRLKATDSMPESHRAGYTFTSIPGAWEPLKALIV